MLLLIRNKIGKYGIVISGVGGYSGLLTIADNNYVLKYPKTFFASGAEILVYFKTVEDGHADGISEIAALTYFRLYIQSLLKNKNKIPYNANLNFVFRILLAACLAVDTKPLKDPNFVFINLALNGLSLNDTPLEKITTFPYSELILVRTSLDDHAAFEKFAITLASATAQDEKPKAQENESRQLAQEVVQQLAGGIPLSNKSPITESTQTRILYPLCKTPGIPITKPKEFSLIFMGDDYLRRLFTLA